MNAMPWRVIGTCGNCGRATTLAEAKRLAPRTGMAVAIRASDGERWRRLGSSWGKIDNYQGAEWGTRVPAVINDAPRIDAGRVRRILSTAPYRWPDDNSLELVAARVIRAGGSGAPSESIRKMAACGPRQKRLPERNAIASKPNLSAGPRTKQPHRWLPYLIDRRGWWWRVDSGSRGFVAASMPGAIENRRAA